MLLVPLLLLVAVTGADARAGPGAAAPSNVPAPAAAAGPMLVRTGVYVLNVGRLDTQAGSYTVDFYLLFRCANEPCTPNEFEFMNGRPSTVDKQDDLPTEKLFRIQASLSTNLDFREYPFDSHRLSVVLEDRHLTSKELVYVPDEQLSGVDPDVIVAGWDLGGSEVSVTEHYYKPFDESYSRYSFDIIIQRAVLSAIMKALLPAIIIVISGFLSFLLGPDKALQRLGINTSALVAAILFHINVTSQVPPTGYLTFADKFMIANYVGLLGALVTTVALMQLIDRHRDVLAQRLHRTATIAVPLGWLVAQGLVVFTR